MNNTADSSSVKTLSRCDKGIRKIVATLIANGVETFESCEGGRRHAYSETTVCFYGQHSEGFKALAIALQHGLRVSELRRYYRIEDGEPIGPYWAMTFILKRK
jgi:hypothetical protein